MKYLKFLVTLPFLGFLLSHGQSHFNARDFQSPGKEYYPTPFWHINGEMTNEGIIQQMTDAKELAKFNGVAVLPVSSTRPEFLSKDYFEKFKLILETAKRLDVNVILYDDIGFPSGSAGGEMEKKFPDDLRKIVTKHETVRSGNGRFLWRMPIPNETILAVVAMNVETLERVNLLKNIRSGWLTWTVPNGTWKIMFFTCENAPFWKNYLPVDYLDQQAVSNFINLTYDRYAEQFENHFGSTITLTFFDDVGFLRMERTWTGRYNEKFLELYGHEPDLYYPALWYDIGPDTEAARVALFNTRSELMAEGFPKMVTEWTRKHGLKNTGHPPGNYGIQPVDMSGDIFKYYRYTDIPLADLIIEYGRGRDGFKLISSASDLYNRSVTATEIYGALKEDIVDPPMLYRALMEIQARGINFVIPHGMWYDPTKVSIPPLVSPFSEKLAPILPLYSDYTARSCYMLQHGSRVSEIALIYPIASLQAGFYFDAPDNLRAGTWAYPEADYLEISGMLTNEIRRDFTFVHPEYFVTQKYSIHGGMVRLNHDPNIQEYNTIILPGGSVISVETLEKINAFYDAGGNVIATTLLPEKSAEFGRDNEIEVLTEALFGKDAALGNDIRTNENGGKSLFIKELTTENLSSALELVSPNPAVIFESKPIITSELGLFSYLHKRSKGKDFWFFANSSDDLIDTDVLLRGKHQVEQWDPHTGEIVSKIKVSYEKRNNVTYTRCHLNMKAVSATFLICK